MTRLTVVRFADTEHKARFLSVLHRVDGVGDKVCEYLPDFAREAEERVMRLEAAVNLDTDVA